MYYNAHYCRYQKQFTKTQNKGTFIVLLLLDVYDKYGLDWPLCQVTRHIQPPLPKSSRIFIENVRLQWRKNEWKFIKSGIWLDNNLVAILWFQFTIQDANYMENLILWAR